MKKILFVAPFPPPIHGASLRNQSVADSELINRQFVLKTFAANQANDVNDIGVFSWRKILKTIKDTVALIQVLYSFRPDLVYFNISLFGFALYRDTVYTTIFKLNRTKLLYHLRTQGVQDQVTRSFLKKTLFKYLFHNVDVICLSHRLSTDIAGIYQHQPYIVGNGIPVESTLNVSGQKNSRIPTVLFLSNLNKKKGIDDLLQAFGKLKEKEIPYKGIIVGRPFDYTEADINQKCAEIGIQEEVQVVGPLYGEKKIDVFLSSDIFVLPTYFEAFPGVILEAMQFGLPVVSTQEGAIPEMVQHTVTGLLVEKQNVPQLVGAIEQLLYDQSAREKMGILGRKRFYAEYTQDIAENNLVEVFNQVLDDH